ncbi:hypothetical protein AA103196_0777 [Ameyamaea chiangmaiensis NBRC 103196]|uniref:DUF3293 domain-containing protein n=1 Tax=Ameyamaea chiangmaiensis TaxID=442969 RepID=A0A850PEE2_9PROT|nr:DUF3293 domain-containing protein [Ameyamaea chiangmaiensis]MBS4075880.1 DUF3293 domain-containing protein [Ameyamaea chiangmaiensis]NVN41233.1 DUF3293 domain-containing protein [Ameyamaea chiangmaiensis]GBQ64081.1 hypothetical protein AA103196_0777 [Ameyamaea chiangmaiensis NBRC 103196]
MKGVRPPTAAIARAYRRSLYTSPGFSVRIGRPASGRWPLPGGRLVFLGACNPGGRAAPEGRNARMMQRLDERLRGLSTVPGEGRLGRWAEPMILVACPPRRVRRLARLFGQNALVDVRRGRRPRLVWTF